MTWYSVRILYERLIEEDTTMVERDAFFEERVFMLSAEPEEDVLERTQALAREKELTFDNVEGNRVDWRLHEILEIQELDADNIGDGTEVYYRHWSDPTDADFEHLRKSDQEPWWRQ